MKKMKHTYFMRKLKVYLETTMFNLYFDTEIFGHDTAIDFFNAIEHGDFEPYTSRYVTNELENASEPKRSKMLALIDKYKIYTFPATDEDARLANIYIEQHDGIPEKKGTDALHIASASVHSMDAIISCNFRHINKDKTKRMVEYINKREGYQMIRICRPEELMNG
jgi:predicted nucleic acid-binding protein